MTTTCSLVKIKNISNKERKILVFLPWLLHQQFLDKIFGQIRTVLKSLFVEGEVDGHDVLVGLLLGVAQEGREAGEHDVGDDPDAPEVGVEREGLVVDDLRGHKLRGPEHLSHLRPWHDLTAEAEVDEFDGAASVVEEHHVLRLKNKKERHC